MDRSFEGLLGYTPRIKILKYLIIGADFEYHIKDISIGTGVSRPSCHKEIKELLELKIVKKGSKYKGKQLYCINKASNSSKALYKCFKIICRAKNQY